METTTIEISKRNWRWLNRQKNTGETFNDVVDEIREDYNEQPE